MWPFKKKEKPRENYLPKATILRDVKTGKYFAVEESEWCREHLCKTQDGWGLLMTDVPAMFDSLDDIFDALYEVAKNDHLGCVYRELTEQGLSIEV